MQFSWYYCSDLDPAVNQTACQNATEHTGGGGHKRFCFLLSGGNRDGEKAMSFLSSPVETCGPWIPACVLLV